MDRQAFTIIFVIIMVIGVISLGISKVTSSQSTTALATPTPSASLDPIFALQNQKNALAKQQDQERLQTQQNGQMTTQQTQQQTQQTNTQTGQFPGVLPPEALQNKKAVISVAGKGTIEFEIYPDAPLAASNFITLAEHKFYNGLTFHRVESGFVIQGGDPKADGTGGPGYTFADDPVSRAYTKGIVAMANAGPNTNGSQFFIVLGDNIGLPPKYSIFGHVTVGQDVVDKVTKGDVMESVTIKATQ